MRILHINEFYAAVGGAETYVAALLPALKNAGYDVGLLYYRKPHRETPTGDWVSSYVPSLDAKCGLAVSQRQAEITAAIESFNPDIVELHQIEDPLVLGWIGRRWPTVQFLHAHYPLICPGEGKFLSDRKEVCHRKVGPFCMVAPYLQKCASLRPWTQIPKYLDARAYLRNSHFLRRFLVASHYMRDELVLNGIPSDKIEVTGLPIPETFIEAANENSAEQGTGTPEILYVGRLIRMKGVDVLLKALSQLAVPYHCTIVGEGPDLPLIKQLASELGLWNHVFFAGWSDAKGLSAHYRKASVVAVPSLWPEPFGMVGLEAMAFSKPLVAFDVGGIREWLRDGDNGLLVPPKNVNGFATALQKVLENRDLAERLGAFGKRFVQEHFRMETHVANLSRIYEEARR